MNDYSAVIFNSKNSVDHYFRLAKELRIVVPETMKYFCSSEAIALYLQTYIQYRKRKIFFGQQYFSELIDILNKHREETFLFPCSDEKTEYTKALDRAKIKYTRATMYVSVPRDLSHFNLHDFDLLALFSPIGVRSLMQNFPNFNDDPIPVAAFGVSTHNALNSAGVKLTIAAPTKSSPSMAMAIENYLQGKEQEAVISTAKPTVTKTKSAGRTKTATPQPVKKVKSVFTDKAKYKQLQEERKAQAAARRAERAAAKAAEMEAKAKREAEMEEANKVETAVKAEVNTKIEVKAKIEEKTKVEAKPKTTTKSKATIKTKEEISLSFKKWANSRIEGGVKPTKAIFKIEENIINAKSNYSEEKGLPTLFSTQMFRLAEQLLPYVIDGIKYIEKENEKKRLANKNID